MVLAHTYAYPVLGSADAYVDDSDIRWEQKSMTHDRTDIHITGMLYLRCPLLEGLIKDGRARAWLHAAAPNHIYREVRPVTPGRIYEVLGGAAGFAENLHVQFTITASSDIGNFYNKTYHNPEYADKGGSIISIPRGAPLAFTVEMRARHSIESVGSAIEIRPDRRIHKSKSFTIDYNNDKIILAARPELKNIMDSLHRNDRRLFDACILAPVLAYVLPKMQECRDTYQWAKALDEKCTDAGIPYDEITDRPYEGAQRLLHGTHGAGGSSVLYGILRHMSPDESYNEKQLREASP